MTRWEKFAKDKGILRKKKRSRMVFDEVVDDWVPRWGAHRSGSEGVPDDWATEKWSDPKDPFGDIDSKQALQKTKVARRQKRNIAEMVNGAGLPGNLALTTGGPAPLGSTKSTKKVGNKPRKEDLDFALTTVARSTASMGGFDTKLRDEPKRDRGLHKARDPVVRESAAEKAGNMNVLKSVLGSEGSVDADRAARLYNGATGGAAAKMAVRDGGVRKKKKGKGGK